LETLDLYQKGRSAKEIAAARGLKESTVFDHLVFLMEKGIIKKEEADKLVPLATQRKIMKAIQKVGREKLKPIFDLLGGDVAYHEIKLTLVKES
jgi:ATP-dependent DNA helicase RecQ